MKLATKRAQISSIRNFQQKLRKYINAPSDKKARVFTVRGLKDIIFHLQTISTITDESKIAQKAAKLEKLFWKILIFELNGRTTVSKNKGRSDDGRTSPKEKQPKV